MANQKNEIMRKLRTLVHKASQWFEGPSVGSANVEPAIHIEKETEISVYLTIPSDGARVPERPFVEGTVADRRARIWVVVHPMEVSDYWVQPPVTVREDGVWKTQIHIGRPGMIDVGKRFEIRAVADPRKRLREGVVLGWWPEAAGESQVIEVTRI